jgi:hypothetical protein
MALDIVVAKSFVMPESSHARLLRRITQLGRWRRIPEMSCPP